NFAVGLFADCFPGVIVEFFAGGRIIKRRGLLDPQKEPDEYKRKSQRNFCFEKFRFDKPPEKELRAKPEAERKAAEEKFKEIGEAKDYLTNNASGANTETIDEDAI
ncbi:16668_t:CDS:1, partial [Funneliformis geosporum]